MPSPVQPPDPTPDPRSGTPRAAPSPAPAPDVLDRLRDGALSGATRLDLRGCGLSALPPEVFALADTLQVLDLSDNALTDLPDTLPRLHRLRVLFASGNPFTTLPAVLGRCPALQLIGVKSCAIREVPADALPPTLRWLILTDNRIAHLPDTLGACTPLQKLMLAGNRLHCLPATIARCRHLELVRLAANRFENATDALPDALLALPRLAWLAHGGNPFGNALEQQAATAAPAPAIPWTALRLDRLLGEGASGHIHAATWQPAQGAAQAVAVKLFKGDVTSDGLPQTEMAAAMAAGDHAHLVGVLGRLADHPAGVPGLVLRRIPADHAGVAAPPSLDSCSRDVYPPDRRWSGDAALAIADGLQQVLDHLHRQGLTHGDLYGHNTVADVNGHALLGDFGAASFLPAGDPARRAALQRIDRRALGVLQAELAARCADAEAATALHARAQALLA